MIAFAKCFASVSFGPVNVKISILVRHGVVHIVFGHSLRVDGVLVHHVPLPVIFPREGFAALPRVFALGLGAVELAGLAVLVLNVALQVCNGTETPLAPRTLAGPRPVVVPPVDPAIV